MRNKEMACYEPTAHLVTDHQGRPIVYITLYYDDLEAAPGKELSGTFKIYLEPLEAKQLGISLLRVGQDGIEAEIEHERRELARSLAEDPVWNPKRRGQPDT